MTTLHLNLVRKWFDMISSGIKSEEYREITTYWCSKFLLFQTEHKKTTFWQKFFICNKKGTSYYLSRKSIEELKILIKDSIITFKKYDTITFSNGMTPPVPRFGIWFNSFEIREGFEEWGAEKSKEYFVLKLKEIIK